MRALAWILLGLIVGSYATLTVVNVLNASSAVPKGLMAMMGYHKEKLGEAIKAEDCSESTRRHVQAFAVLSRDIKPAFMPLGDSEELFGRYAVGLQQAADAALQSPAGDCAAWVEPIAKIGDACKACHRDFK